MHKYTILCSVAVLQHMVGDYPLTKEDIIRSFYFPHIGVDVVRVRKRRFWEIVSKKNVDALRSDLSECLSFC